MSQLLGIEIGGTKLQLLLAESPDSILQRCQLSVDRALGAAGIRAQIERALPGLLKGRPPRATGVGFGGPVEWRTGRICRSHQIEGWSEFDLAGWLRPITGGPVVVDNDANVAALGEALHGAGRRHADCPRFFYVTLGSGVGGGLVVDGAIYHGASPGETEIGHVRLDREGAIVESRCSGWAVDARVRNELGLRHPSGGEAKMLTDLLSKQDPKALAILKETAADLAFALSHVVHLLHPDVIILGGGLSKLGEPLRRAVAEALPQWVMEAFVPGLRVTLAALGEHAVPVGALALAARHPG